MHVHKQEKVQATTRVILEIKQIKETLSSQDGKLAPELNQKGRVGKKKTPCLVSLEGLETNARTSDRLLGEKSWGSTFQPSIRRGEEKKEEKRSHEEDAVTSKYPYIL